MIIGSAVQGSFLSKASSYLRLGRNDELWGEVDIGHFAVRSKCYRNEKGVFNLDRRGYALPDWGHHLDGANWTRRNGLEGDKVEQVFLCHLVAKGYLELERKNHKTQGSEKCLLH